MKITNIFLHNILKGPKYKKKYTKNEAYVGKIQVKRFINSHYLCAEPLTCQTIKYADIVT